MRIYTLQAGEYTQVDTSPTFAPVPVTEIPRFLQERKSLGEIAVTRNFRNWIKQIIQV